MPAKKKSGSKKNTRMNYIDNIVLLLAYFLAVDGILRLLFSTTFYYILPQLYNQIDLYFHLRWFGIGITEVFLAWGISNYRKWAWYGIIALTIIRIFTMIAYPPHGVILPLSSNWITYSFKLVFAVLVVYLLLNRKKFKIS